MINLENMKTEKKTIKSGTRLQPTFHKIFKEVARRKRTTMIKLVEDYIIQEYIKLEKEDANNGK